MFEDLANNILFYESLQKGIGEFMSYEMKVNEKTAKHAYEMLYLIDKAEGDEKVRLLKKWGSKTPLDMILSLNFNSKVKLELPEGTPPYKRDETIHPDLKTPTAGQIGRLKACLQSNPIKKMDKERVFIQVLELIPHIDADVIVAAKDKALEELFPTITKDLVASVFPNYVG